MVKEALLMESDPIAEDIETILESCWDDSEVVVLEAQFEEVHIFTIFKLLRSSIQS